MTQKNGNDNFDVYLSKQKSAKKSRKFKVRPVRWYKFWMVKAASFLALIIFCGYLASIIVTVQGVQSVTKMAFDNKVEELLRAYLDNLKMINNLNQRLLASRLDLLIAAEVGNADFKSINSEIIRKWLIGADVDRIMNLQDITITKDNASELNRQNRSAKDVEWISRSSLRIFSYIIEFPDSTIKGKFKSAQESVQRYQGVRANWETNIRPTLIKLQIVILMIMGSFLIGALLFFTQKFKMNVDKLLAGFITWSERDSRFRFNDHWHGELKMIARQFNKMADEVEENRKKTLYLEKVASWQIIARKLAHEIKNPLTPIQMMVSQLARSYGGNDNNFKELLDRSKQVIIEEISNLKHMVSNFSRFAQLPQPKFESDDLIAVCRNAVELQQALFSQHKVSFSSKETQAISYVDAQLLKRVITNLIKNAQEACGQKPSEIKVELIKRDNYYIINVIDNGPGIPKDIQQRIFEAYFTTKHTGPNPGMGLGLSICQKIVLDHDGKIDVISHPGQTIVQIKLPCEASNFSG